jgi:hypothetical protein
MNHTKLCKQQDPLGKSIGFKRRYANDHDVWAGPLADGSTVASELVKFSTENPLIKSVSRDQYADEQPESYI